MSPGKTDKPSRTTEPAGNTTQIGATEAPQPRAKTPRSRRQKTDALVASELDNPNPPQSDGHVAADTPPVGDGLDSEIQAQAYANYLSRGGEGGDAVSDWLEAERIVRERRQPRDTEERAPM